MKKIISLVMCLCLCMSMMTGCGKSEEEVVTNSIKALNNAKNYDMNVSLKGKMSVSFGEKSQDADIDISMKETVFTEPMKCKVVASFKTAGQENQVESYMQESGGSFDVYTKPLKEADWSKINMSDVTKAMKEAGVQSTQKFKEDFASYKKLEDKEENGKKYYLYECALDADNIKETLNGLGSSMTSMLGKDIDEEMYKKIVDKMGDIKMTFWFDQESAMLSRIEYPMTDLMNNVIQIVLEEVTKVQGKDDDGTMASIMSQVKMSVSDMDMIMDIENVDSAQDFEIPQEALNAKEFSAEDMTNAESQEKK